MTGAAWFWPVSSEKWKRTKSQLVWNQSVKISVTWDAINVTRIDYSQARYVSVWTLYSNVMALKQITRVSAKYVFAKPVRISLLGTHAVFTCFFSDRYTMPLGMEDGRILSGHLRASSSYNYNHGPNRARLNIYASHGRTGAWVAKYRSSNQWLQIDLRQMCIIKGIATQGRREAHQWVKTFQLSYSLYGARFRSYVSYGRVKVILLTL